MCSALQSGEEFIEECDKRPGDSLTIKLAILFVNKADSCLDLIVICHVELNDFNRSFDAGVTQLFDCFMTRFLDTP